MEKKGNKLGRGLNQERITSDQISLEPRREGTL